jgi:hypothetical protein
MVDRRGTRIGGVLAIAACLQLLVACQLVAGVQSREADPIASGCALPSGTGPQVRVANFVPNADSVDVCIRVSGTSWGEPIILNGGTGCGKYFTGASPGFTYSEVSVPFTAPASRVDVKMIAGGGNCNAPALTEGDGLTLATNAITTLVRIGGNGTAQQILALPELDGSPMADGGRYRVVHAMPGLGPVDFGDADQTHLPATITGLFAQDPIAYGHTATKGTPGLGGPVEDNGYVVVLDAEFNLALGVHGAGNALVLEPSVEVGNDHSSFYLSGITGSDAYPPQGFICPEDAGSTTIPGNAFVVSCQASALPTISIDVFNASLYGPNAPDWQQRFGALASPSELTQSSADVMCILEVDQPTEQQAIIQTAASSGFKYSYAISTNLMTPFTNPRTQEGTTPALPTTAPCGGSVPSSAVTAAMKCMEQSCSDQGPSDPTGANGSLTTTTDCLTENCMGQLEELFIGYPACFDCIVDYVASTQTYAYTQSQCTTQPSPPLGFQGATQNFILSRYPLANTDAFILPSTLYRSTALYAQVQLDGNVSFDFYCAQLNSTLNASSEPYDGFYGGDASASQGQYDNEQTYEAVQLVDWVKSKSGDNPAIITGDWHSSVGSATGGNNDAGFPLATPLNAQTMNAMSGAKNWIAANTPAWNQAPLCNICPCAQNSLQCPGDLSYFVLQPFLYSWPQGASAVFSESLAYTDSPIMLSGGGTAPLSQYFGLNIHVIRPNAKAGSAGADAGTPP